MDYNSAPNENIGDWYQLFITDNSQQVEPKEQTVAAKNALGELMIYTVQARACSEFIMNIMIGLDSIIKNDIINDEIAEFSTSDKASEVQDPQNTPGMVGPTHSLTTIVLNRDNIVKASERLHELVRNVDSILARVKLKEGN